MSRELDQSLHASPLFPQPPVVIIDPPPGAAQPPLESARSAATASSSAEKERFTRLVSAFAFLLLLSFFLPYTVEKMTYAIARGKQRAKYELAGDKLQQVGLHQLSDAYQLVVDRVGPSVVHINVTAATPETVIPLPEGWSWQHPPTGQGSGVIVDSDGYIVTNRHVVQNAERIEVKLSDGRKAAARIVGVDPETDMAVLKISAPNLFAAQWGDSDELSVGALVWALGSPLGLQQSVTFGILSGKHRSFHASMSPKPRQKGGILLRAAPYQDFLQTDAAVNPGNSGGPLVDSQGRVVGINTAIVGEAYQGISFAIPSNVARAIYQRIRQDGRVTRGWLGVQPGDVTPEVADQLGLPAATGALVQHVQRAVDGVPTPAQQAGLQAKDVILRWNGQAVKGRTDLFYHVGMTEVGTTVDVIIWREGQRRALQVTVGERT